ncbi:MAG: hypothetical protein NT023_09065 [Armatimonadetes bacterium]|nr:hypothetical protein [Armatimonadota bacterium]
MIMPTFTATALLCALCLNTASAYAQESLSIFNHAVVVTPPKTSPREHKAVTMLVEEIEKRTRIHLRTVHALPKDDTPAILVGVHTALLAIAPSKLLSAGTKRSADRPEGYIITASHSVVAVAGNDERGVLFGVGRLLRSLHLERDSIAAPHSMRIVSHPRYPLRGHQLGYRPKTNSYDAWSVPMWEQYIRDLAVFGANAVELIPPKSDDAADSHHFPLPPMQMMTEMSRLLDEYGLDVWIWYPAMERDYSNPKTVQASLKEWGDVFQKLPRVDAVFVPGGDPGHTQPKVLMAFLEKEAKVLRRSHPKAQMWVSPQGFTKVWMDEFLAILRKESPKWLTGVVFGPQVRLSLPELRAQVPSQYPIRHYPDITHSRQCEYPVPDWDTAYALTEGREGINPRPLDQAHLFRKLQKYTVGFLTYSEGCNDDVNKAIWSALGWNPDADVHEILREYSRYFVNSRHAESFAQGLLALERNWRGSLAQNEGVNATLKAFQSMEHNATLQERSNWRFQQALYRAYYDAYLRDRLIYEQGQEEEALSKLAEAQKTGSLAAMAEAERILEQAKTPQSQNLRARVFELAEALFQSIRMQLSVERYQAIGIERGANLDSIDVPLNNRKWLLKRFVEVRKQGSEDVRLEEIAAIVHWTDPGEGGFYDELGNPLRRPHLLNAEGFQSDPGTFETSRVGFCSDEGEAVRMAWLRHAESLYDAPLQMRYTKLDANAHYRLRVVYRGDSLERKIRLVANNSIEIHAPMVKPKPTHPLEFDIPAEATRNGELLLSWTGEAGRGGNGRGCQVSEVWLIRK